MQKLFEYDMHIGDWRVLVQARDIQNGAVQGRHITAEAVTGEKIADETVEGRSIAPDAVTGDKIADRTVTGRNIAKEAITNEKLVDECITGDEIEGDTVRHGKLANDAVHERNIKDRNVTARKIAADNILTEHLKDRNVTPEKLSESVQGAIVTPLTNSLDRKYTNITNELYTMIRSLQVGGLALSGKLGNRDDIGIHQKALTKMFGRLWEEFGIITGKTYMDFTFKVEPSQIYSEATATVTVTADCSDAISDFDSIRIYRNDELVAESGDVSVFTTTVELNGTSVIRAEGVIMGKAIIKEQTVYNEVPFFMGSGKVYTDVVNEASRKPLIGTLEGEYDITVNSSGDFIFVVLPASRKEEFRRCKLDMDGFEIPLTVNETQDLIICKSTNRYAAGIYNIDININS